MQNKQCILNFECTSVPWSHLHHSDRKTENQPLPAAAATSSLWPPQDDSHWLPSLLHCSKVTQQVGHTAPRRTPPAPPVISHCVVQSANELRASLWPRLHHPEHTELLSGAVTRLFLLEISFSLKTFLTFKKTFKWEKILSSTLGGATEIKLHMWCSCFVFFYSKDMISC